MTVDPARGRWHTRGGIRRRSATTDAYETLRAPVQQLVPTTAQRILDVGCASGRVGGELKARQRAEIVGIDLNRDYEADAAARLDRFICANIEDYVADDGFAAELGTFDCIVLADVLEHLRDPWTVLDALVTILDRGGHVVVSLPNVRYLGVALQVFVKGTWPRQDVGLFDATHLRWFTESDMRALLSASGLAVARVAHLYRLRTAQTRMDRVAQYFGPAREFFAYQLLALAQKP